MSDNATGLLMVKPFYNRNTNKQTDLKMTINLRENNSILTHDSDVNNNQYMYSIRSIRGEVWFMKPHFIDVLVPNQVMYKCVRSIDMVSVSTMFVLDFRTTSIMMVWYFGGFSFHYSKIYVFLCKIHNPST